MSASSSSPSILYLGHGGLLFIFCFSSCLVVFRVREVLWKARGVFCVLGLCVWLLLGWFMIIFGLFQVKHPFPSHLFLFLFFFRMSLLSGLLEGLWKARGVFCALVLCVWLLLGLRNVTFGLLQV